MNYGWRYRGGGRENIEAYWRVPSPRRFSEIELAFLHHAPRAQGVPGGSPFGSASYGSAMEAAGQVTPPWSDLRLWLTPPLDGTTFAYGQPILLEVSLLNTGAKGVDVPRQILDVKAGQLDLIVRPLDGPNRKAGSQVFASLIRRCFGDVEGAGRRITLSRGESLHNNVNLTYGSQGFTCQEPGTYELTPVLSFPATDQADNDKLVVGRSLRISVARPERTAEEQEGQILLGRSDVGVWMALGGSHPLAAAGNDLEDLRKRRERRSGADSVISALVRLAGIAAGRTGDSRRAARLLSRATRIRGGGAFDPQTLQHTRRLAARYRRPLTVPERSLVVVDLWSRPRSGGRPTGGRGPGFLVTPTRDARAGSLVLASATQLPADAMTAGSSILARSPCTAVSGTCSPTAEAGRDVSEIRRSSCLDRARQRAGRFRVAR
ncbi:MAG TPA: hypothetical protein VFJ50_03800 [Gemmatimonadales bacterium]|nr:hypothetical protein [Gemmatimonadales bacterium]